MGRRHDSKEHLLEEVTRLRQQIIELERSAAERGQMEERLRESERRFRAIADYTSDCECWLDSTGRLVWTNPAIFRLTGYTVDECTAMPDFPLPLVDGEDRDRLDRYFAQAVQGSSGNDVEFRLRRKDGSPIWVSTSWQPIYASDGSSMGHRTSIRDITKRKQTEEILKRSEDLLSSIIEFLPDPTFAIGLQGRIISWNRAMEEMSGVSAESMLGKGDYEYALPFYGKRCPTFVDLLSHWDDDIARQYSFIKKDGDFLCGETDAACVHGKKRTLWMKAGPLRNAEGDIIGAIESVRDITERIESETALREAKEYTENLIKSANVLIVGLDPVGNVTLLNETGEKTTGYGIDEIRGKNWFELIVPTTTYPHGWEDFNRLKNGDVTTGTFENPIRTKSGEERIISWKNSVLRQEGKFLGTISFGTDITDQKQAEEALRKSEARFRQFIEKAHIPLCIMAKDGLLGYFNDRFTKTFGYTHDDIRTLNEWWPLAYPDERYRRWVTETWEAAVQKAGEESGDIGPMEYSVTCKNGTVRNVEISGITMEDNLLVTFVDITERKRAEEAFREAHDDLERRVEERTRQLTEAYDNLRRETERRRKMEDHLRQGQKLEALGTLAGGIAHDFNNVLAAIIGFSEMVLENLDPYGSEHRRLELVLKGANRGRDLVKQILLFTRHAEQDLKPLMLGEAIKEGLKLLRPALPSTVEMVWKDVEGDDVILADPVHIHQILMNLCTNAAYAMREKGGTLHIGISSATVEENNQLSEPEIMPGEYVVLEVRDTGTGMEPETLERIFDPFFTTKRRGEGTGLGLSVVHGIVNSMGGHITVESEPGIGTSFHVYLRKAGEHAYGGGRQATPITGGKECILLVDDEDIMITLDEERLTGLGYEVVATTSSREALEIFRENPDRFDLVITDYTMPNLTGIDLAVELRKVKGTVPIILWTGYNEAVSRERVEKAGIKAFLMKPSNKRVLAETIRRVLNAETEERHG